MRWPLWVGLLALGIGASGCATSAHRDDFSLPGETPTANLRPVTRTTAPRQSQVSVPAQADDPFTQSTTTGRFDKYRLYRLFAARRGPAASTVVPAAAVASLTTAEPAVAGFNLGPTGIPAAAAVPPAQVAQAARPSWFGLRKPKTSQVYVTDARSAPDRSRVEPALLPLALQVPSDPNADRAVTTVSVDVPAAPEVPATGTPSDPAPAPAPVPAVAEAAPVPSNPDSSSVEAGPISKSEPQLAITPIAPPTRSARAPADPTATQPVAVATPTTSDDSMPERLRGRPRLQGRTSSSITPAAMLVEARPAAKVAPPAIDEPAAPPVAEPTRPEASAAGATTLAPAVAAPVTKVAAPTDLGTAHAVLSPADPSNSLGLPEATVPASYSKTIFGSIRGSSQSAQPPQPPPVLASPQVETTTHAAPSPQATPKSHVVPSSQVKPTAQVVPSPQGEAKPAKKKCFLKTMRKPSFRRFLRRCGGTGEFATPPTCQPH